MEPHFFDDLSKVLAEGLTRRGALQRIGGTLAGGLLAAVGLGKAWAAPPPTNCAGFCRSLGFTPGGGNAYGQCVSNCANCKDAGGTPCGADDCCLGDEVCCGGACISCPAGTELDPNTCECVPVSTCSGACLEACGTSGECFCTTSIEGIPSCGSNFFCGTTPSCTSSAECIVQGFAYCQAPGCGSCGQVCVPACGSPTLAAPTLGAGRTNSGL